LEHLLDGFAYNPLTLQRGALTCVSHGLLTRYTVRQPERTLDTFLKDSIRAYLAEDARFARIPGFAPWLTVVPQARWAEAMRAMVRLNADRITLIAGKDTLYLRDATFKLLKPAREVDLIIWKPAQTSSLRVAPAEITAKPWTVRFVDAFMSGKSIDWKDFDLATLTQGSSSGTRCLPEDYRTLANQFVRDYGQIWQNILVIPGKMSFGQAV
jgi:hypothetical protein